MKNQRVPSPQESFWAGDFGNSYITRNASEDLLASNISFFSQALRHAGRVESCLELGANIGMNLRALRALYPSQKQQAVELNAMAAEELRRELPHASVVEGSILDFDPTRTWDLVLVKGVLIHLNPDSLGDAYSIIHAASGRHILIAEYYSPAPVSVTYRGHNDRLFKRDFAGELMDTFPDLELVDYGFVYHRDNAFPQDDINWFLLKCAN